MKHKIRRDVGELLLPAAFRRLCVETSSAITSALLMPCQPPLGGCVLKPEKEGRKVARLHPAAFRRLCVETALAYRTMRQK